MLNKNQIQKIKNQGRCHTSALPGEENLGPLKLLPETWKNLPNLPGRRWNALTFATEPDSRLNYRLLFKQYNETLKFNFVDKGIPNRGIRRNGTTSDSDQFPIALAYEQNIEQIIAEDFPESGKAGKGGDAIHLGRAKG